MTTAYRRLDRSLAMWVAGVFGTNQISRDTWSAFARRLGVSPPLALRLVPKLRDAVLDQLPAVRDGVVGELRDGGRLVGVVQAIGKAAPLAGQSVQ